MAMITLDFEIDEQALIEDGQFSPATANAAALEETYFVTSVRFSIDGVDLLDSMERPARGREVVAG